MGNAISVRAKAGRCFNGAERDQGYITHAVPDHDFPSWTPALCGAVPGARGNGWKDPSPEGTEITCKRCLRSHPNE